MPSGQSTALMVVLGLGLAFTRAACADHRPETCTALVDARAALWSMMDAKDKSSQDSLNAKVQATSTKLDTVLAAKTGPEATLAAEFKAVWDQFKATREDEIIPAVYAG